MKRNNEEYVSINLNKPENLVLEDMIKPELPFFASIRRDDGTSSHKMSTGKNIRKHIPALYYFVHVLLERQHSDIDVLRCWYAKDFVEMFSRDIEPVKSKNYFRFIWGILRSLQVIEDENETRPNKYRKSAKAYYFRFTKKYSEAKVVEHQIMVKKTIADKLNNKWKKIDKKDVQNIDLSKITFKKHMAHQYNALHRINFDADGALALYNKLLEENSITVKQYNTGKIAINNILNGKIKVTYSQACHRFFTPVTEMPKELRQFIMDGEGKPLIELDFGSFNAFAVYKIINSIQPEYKSNAEKIAFEIEFDLYRRLLSGGDFYRDFKYVFFPDVDLSRDQIKDIVLKFWFNGKLNSRNKYRKYMLKRMPRISEIIDCLKVQEYSNFSNTTMRMESELVNDIIYKRFVELHPDAIMYTIFDSFLVEQRYAAQLLSMMREEGSMYFDLNCVVRAKEIKVEEMMDKEQAT